MDYAKYLVSKHWVQTKVDILSLRNKCERCGSVKRLQVHHLSYKNLFNENPEDLEVLCAGCHLFTHGLLKPKKKPKKQLLSKEEKKSKRIKRNQKRAIRRIKTKRRYNY